MPKTIFTLIACFILLSATLASAATKRAVPYQNGEVQGWRAVVSDYAHAPSFLIAVDKKDQLVSIFERRSPLSKTAEYICTTGKNEGDKLVEGDLKTPEGVYFIVSHINKGLNYTLYGHEAYPLNYPNPVDRIRKKTGYGIWFHGKGIPVVPYDSNGCVGMYNQDIATFKKTPVIGQPVTLAVDIEYAEGHDPKRADTAAFLVQLVQAWAKAWSDRSSEMFDFYNPEAYSVAQGQSFQNFKKQKEYLFATLPWINTSVHDIQVLEGPGYWVTWFNQDYKAPNLKSYGTRRLYWQPDAAGEMRIVGMEWLNGFKSPVLYAESKPATFTDASVSTTPSLSAKSADQPAASKADPAQAAAKAEKITAQQAKPKESKPVATAEASSAQNARQAEATKKAEQAAAAQPPKQAETAKKVQQPEAGAKKMNAEQEAMAFIKNWQKAWQNSDLNAYASCYAKNAQQGNRKGLQAILAQKKRLWAGVKVRRLDLSNLSVVSTDNGLKAVMRQDYADSQGYSDLGVKVLYLEYDKTWRIVREDWKPLVTQ